MTLFCNWLRLTGLNKRLKISAAHLLTTFCKSFLSLFAPNRMRKLNEFTPTGIFRGGVSGYWFACITATENKSFTESSASLPTACLNTWTTSATNTPKTNTNGNCSHSNTMSSFMGVWQRNTTGQTGMFEYFGKCTLKTGQ